MSFCKKLSVLMLLAAVGAVFGQSQNKPSFKDEQAVRDIEETYRTAWLKNDEKTILGLFTDDATLYPNGGKPVKGKDAIAKFWFAPSDTLTTINAFETTVEEIRGDGKLAVVTGSNEIQWMSEKKDKSSRRQFLSKGYFMAVYVRNGKEWKILKQFWNSKTEEIK